MDSIEQELINITGKHIKQTMLRLEEVYGTTLPYNVRKIILDEFNDAYRELKDILENE